ncbi:MAG: exosortase-associated EpsI family protein [Planctomycetes bacterium]|nr:exosortase-associated EpsI family protein [Planctomycetota bacterium]
MTTFAALFLPLLIAYAATLRWCQQRWDSPTQYFEHCWLLPIVAAVVVWARRDTWRRTVAAPDWRGFWLLGPALLLHLGGAALMIDSLSAASLVLAVPGACWLALGRERLRGQWPVIWLVLFAVPLPIYVEGRLAFELKELAVASGLQVANLFGAGFERAGAELRPVGAAAGLFVADACGGLRSLLAMITIGYCVAFFLGPTAWWRRLALLLVAAPIALAVNIARIAGLCVLARHTDVATAAGGGHAVLDTAAWIVDVALLLLFDLLLSRWSGTEPTTPAETVAPVVGGQSHRGPAVLLWLLAGPLLWLSLYRPFADVSGRAERLPSVVAGAVLQPRDAADQAEFERAKPRYVELLGTRDFIWSHYRDAGGAPINLVALFHDSNWKSVHPPRICIEGSDMDIEIDDLLPVALGQSTTAVSRIAARSRRDGRHHVTLSVFGTRDWLAGSYFEFFVHHAPRALLRTSNAGFMLRVETPIGAGEDAAVAVERCRRFLDELVPLAQELLP